MQHQRIGSPMMKKAAGQSDSRRLQAVETNQSEKKGDDDERDLLLEPAGQRCSSSGKPCV